MKSSEIWEAVKANMVLVGGLATWVRDNPADPLIGEVAAKLKSMVPCFVGIDLKGQGLIFLSEDDGIVGVYMNRIDEKTASLYMMTDLELEN